MGEALFQLQARTLCDAALVLEGVRTAKDLLKQLRRRLSRATREGVLVGDCQHLVWQKSATIEYTDGTHEEVTAIIGGIEINRERSRELRHFPRADGAWFDFHIHLGPYTGDDPRLRGSLELRGYGYEIRFPKDDFDTDIRWLRFDLNHPKHDNEGRGMRCHFHPGDEDLQASSALMQPVEALELLLSTVLQLPDKRRRS
ncbi:MAG: hypothetical protein R6X02_00060 [Enhygromyxa sp.]